MSAKLRDRRTVDGLIDSLDDLEVKFGEAFAAGAAGADDTTEKVNAARDAQIDLRIEVASYLEGVKALPATVVTTIDAKLDEGVLQYVRDTLRALQNPLSVPLDIVARVVNDTGYPIPPILSSNGGSVQSLSAAPNITVNMPRTADPRDINAQLTRWQRVNGSG